jgi:hypothetical protein
MPLTWLLGMAAFFVIGLTVVFRLEKRMVWPYGELSPKPRYDDPTGYTAVWVADAVAAGFTLLGWTHDLKGENYRLSYAILVSPDRGTLAVIGGGFIFKLPLQGTWLHTPTADGRSFYSTDKQAGVQLDVSRHWTSQLVFTSNFTILWQRHLGWLREMSVIPRSFSSGRELQELRELREEHYRSMARAGLIGYLDSSASQFRFTLYGAAVTASLGYFLGLLRAITRGRFPRNA